MPRELDPAHVYPPADLAADPRLESGHYRTLLHLLHASGNTTRCPLDAAALARLMRVTPRTMRKTLAHLEEIGYVADHGDWIELAESLIPRETDIIWGMDPAPAPDPGASGRPPRPGGQGDAGQ